MNLVDLVKGFQTSSYYLVFTIVLVKIGVDTAENGPLKVCQKIARSKLEKQLEKNIGGNTKGEPLLESFRVVDRTGDWELIKQRFDNRVQTESVWPDRHPDLYLKFVTQHHVKDAVLNVDEKQLNIAVERTALPISEEIKSRRAAGQAERSC